MTKRTVDKHIKALIVDDEWLMREEMVAFLSQYPNITIVGKAKNISQAVSLIENKHPDVIFLDIQMPGESGFDLFDQVEITCDVVFVTAHDRYAVQAFEINALDYLLKPINKKRLDSTIERLLSGGQLQSDIPENQMDLEDLLYLMVDNSHNFIKIKKIKCIIAEGNYSYIIIHKDKKQLVSKTLKDWQLILPAHTFVRIHRSTMININYVREIKKCENYTNLVYMNGIETPFEMSRRYAAQLKHLIP